MKASLRSVRVAPAVPPEKPQVDASWLNKNWQYVSIHFHNIDNFRARMAERKARAEASNGTR